MSDCDFDFECIEKNQNTRYYVDIRVLESSPPYSDFQEVLTTQSSRAKYFPKLKDTIKKSSRTRHSANQNTLLIEEPLDHLLLNLSTSNSNKPPFTNSDLVRIDESGLISLRHFDYRTTDEKVIMHENEILENQNAYYKLKSSSIITLDLVTFEKTTLKTFESDLNDSTFIEKSILNIHYSPVIESIIFALEETTYRIDSLDNNPDDWSLVLNQTSVLKLDQNFQVDTLVKYEPRTEGKYFTLGNIQTTRDHLIVGEDSIYIYDYEGNLQRAITGVYPKSYSLINSFTYNHGTWYYNIEEDYSINLSEYVDNITSSNPFEDLILITEEDTDIHIFSIVDRKIINSISLNDLPPVPQKVGKINSTGLYHPILKNDDTIQFLYLDNHYFDDPSDDCEI
jgi:hypothetical protein